MLKIRTLDGDSNIQIRMQFPEQNKTKINWRVSRNFKMEPKTFKSCTLALKERGLTRLEENDNNTAKTEREFHVQNKRVGLLLHSVLSKEFLPETKNFRDAT